MNGLKIKRERLDDRWRRRSNSGGARQRRRRHQPIHNHFACSVIKWMCWIFEQKKATDFFVDWIYSRIKNEKLWSENTRSSHFILFGVFSFGRFTLRSRSHWLSCRLLFAKWFSAPIELISRLLRRHFFIYFSIALWIMSSIKSSSFCDVSERKEIPLCDALFFSFRRFDLRWRLVSAIQMDCFRFLFWQMAMFSSLTLSLSLPSAISVLCNELMHGSYRRVDLLAASSGRCNRIANECTSATSRQAESEIVVP